jgi:hypothetical protein
MTISAPGFVPLAAVVALAVRNLMLYRQDV